MVAAAHPTRLRALAETSREAARKYTETADALNEAECTTLAARYGLMAAEALATAQAFEAGAEALELLKALVVKIDAVHQDPEFEAVWIHSQLRRGPYAGLKYADELDAARAALKRMEEK